MSKEEESFDSIFITNEESGERLDKILATRFNGSYSRTYFQYLIDQHLVLLNGEPIKKRIKPFTGDEVEIQFSALPDLNLTPENIPLTILFEDEHLLAVNKPAGMVVHPAAGNWSGTFVNALLYHCQTLPNPAKSVRPGIVHRLDKETSGVLLAAKTLEAQQKLIEMFAKRQIHKEYIAICLGRPPEQEIRQPLARHPVLRRQMAIVAEGKEAITIPKILKSTTKLSVVELIILTGRTHQIRVHLKHVNAPVLGDPLYGNSAINKKMNISRQFLHAAVLKFYHPITGEILEIKAELPQDMINFINKNF